MDSSQRTSSLCEPSNYKARLGELVSRPPESRVDSRIRDRVEHWPETLLPLDGTDLYLDGTKLDNVVPLKDLCDLERLSLVGTRVSNIDPLKSCTRLRTLDLDHTRVCRHQCLCGSEKSRHPLPCEDGNYGH